VLNGRLPVKDQLGMGWGITGSGGILFSPTVFSGKVAGTTK